VAKGAEALSYSGDEEEAQSPVTPESGVQEDSPNVKIPASETKGVDGLVVFRSIDGNVDAIFGKLYEEGLAAGDDLVFVEGGKRKTVGHVDSISLEHDDAGDFYKVEIDGEMYRLERAFSFLTEDQAPVDAQDAAHNPGAKRAQGPGAARFQKETGSDFTAPPAGSPPGGPPPGYGTSKENFGGNPLGPFPQMNKVRMGDKPPPREPQLSAYERERAAKLVTDWATAMEEERRQELIERTLTQGKRRFGLFGSIFMRGYAEREVYEANEFHLESKDLKMLERHALAVITNNAATLVRDQLLTDSGHDTYRMLETIGLQTDANGNFINNRGNGGFLRLFGRTNRTGGMFGVMSGFSTLVNLGGAGLGGIIGGTLLGAGIGSGLG